MTTPEHTYESSFAIHSPIYTPQTEDVHPRSARKAVFLSTSSSRDELTVSVSEERTSLHFIHSLSSYNTLRRSAISVITTLLRPFDCGWYSLVLSEKVAHTGQLKDLYLHDVQVQWIPDLSCVTRSASRGLEVVLVHQTITQIASFAVSITTSGRYSNTP